MLRYIIYNITYSIYAVLGKIGKFKLIKKKRRSNTNKVKEGSTP